MNPPLRVRVVLAVGAGQLLAWASSYYLLAIVARPMASQLALPPVAVYADFSGALLVAALLGPWAGARVDRHGGRRVLLASNYAFALALCVLATAQGPVSLACGWLLLGAAMPLGLYDAAFSTLVRMYREQARRSIVGVTLVAGFASSVSWPLSALVEAHYGWRAVCVVWALLHFTAGAAIHRYLVPEPPPTPAAPAAADEPVLARAPDATTFWLLAAAFTASGFVFAALAAHLPRLLQSAGATPAAAIAAASLVGVFQVGARVLEAGLLHRLPPLASALIASILHPLGALLLGLAGVPAVYLFTALHGAGVGLMTIVKGTLPLALFGAAGFGRRSGLLEAPSRVAQALAPLLFGLWLDAIGVRVLWISGGLAFAGFAGVLFLGWRNSRGPSTP
ncbi:MAG TPA: MFS transporter [Solimonas sp.]|nr:MFS transporter [Solimonas sp.]